ncbi:aromatic ring-hydroxylating dioxygenase subunit alpha [Pusillimonas caeni]|nr:aromatic ring-hydroxylating dioxygenase subunit alpha [Pusillimonas caeni]
MEVVMSSTPIGQCQPYDPRNANYPLNLWWVAGRSEELEDGKLVSRKLLGTDVLLYRKSDGSVAAMEDRCIHRGLPLSMGWLDGDKVVCRYHGFKYSHEGKLVEIPTQERCPKRGALRTFPIVERAPFLWIWMGPEEEADIEEVSDFPWLRDPNWVWAGGHLNIMANYMLLKENVLDLTHFPFVHQTTFGALDDYEAAATFVQEGSRVAFIKEFNNQPLSPIYNKDLEWGDRLVNRTDKGMSVSPAEHLFTATIVDPNAEPGERSEYLFRFQHLTTPETNTTHHYWWAASRNYGVHDNASAWIASIAQTAFAEDKEVLEAIQRRINESPAPLELPEVSAIADQGGLMARRQLQAYMERESR